MFAMRLIDAVSYSKFFLFGQSVPECRVLQLAVERGGRQPHRQEFCFSPKRIALLTSAVFHVDITVHKKDTLSSQPFRYIRIDFNEIHLYNDYLFGGISKHWRSS